MIEAMHSKGKNQPATKQENEFQRPHILNATNSDKSDHDFFNKNALHQTINAIAILDSEYNQSQMQQLHRMLPSIQIATFEKAENINLDPELRFDAILLSHSLAKGFDLEQLDEWMLPRGKIFDLDSGRLLRDAPPLDPIQVWYKWGTSLRSCQEHQPNRAQLREWKDFAGITRVARIDSLCNFNIPIYSCSRPKSKLEITVSGGKGINAHEAKLGSIFEGVEYAGAERPFATIIKKDIKADSSHILDPLNLAPEIDFNPEVDSFSCTHVREFFSNEIYYAPSCAVGLLPEDCAPFTPSTNGLASGKSFYEAMLHGLLEIIERHNYSIALLERQAKTVSIQSLKEDLHCAEIIHELEAIDLKIEVKDISHPTGIPTFFALLINHREKDSYLLGGGFGTHLDATIAARRALLEAAQSRSVAIAGGREDLNHSKRLFSSDYERSYNHFKYWYEPTAEQVNLSDYNLPYDSLSLRECSQLLIKKAKAHDPSLGRIFYRVLPSPKEVWVVRSIWEHAEVFGLIRNRMGYRVRDSFARVAR